MRRDVPETELCQARIYAHGYYDRCSNRHKEEREGYQLCGLHARRFDQGHEVEIADKPDDSPYHLGFHMRKKTTIQKTFENEDEKRYEQRGVFCEEVDPNHDKTKWLAAEPDKGVVLCNALDAVERRRARAQRDYEREMAYMDEREKMLKEELDRWKKGEPEPEEQDCEECCRSLRFNEERERGTCNHCAGEPDADVVECLYCDEPCETAEERKRGVCDTCQAEEDLDDED